MSKKTFQAVFDKAQRAGVSINDTRASMKWLEQNITNMKVSQKSVLEDKTRARSKITVGRMYMFVYDAKTKDKLPYWDKFPLVFPFAPAPGGFYGINLHYLPPYLRAKLFDALMHHTQGDMINEATKLRISYDILKSASTNKYFAPCVKRYLNSHVRSQFINIQPSEWMVALFLPTEKFQGASKQQVWKDSKARTR